MATIVVSRFGRLADNQDVDCYTLTNDAGIEVCVLGWGARLAACRVPDRDGNAANVVLAHRDFAGWHDDAHCLGATVGRVANRIAGSKFELDGDTVYLPANEGEHHLHGGHEGFDRRLWAGVIERDADGSQGLSMYLDSEDGDEGYPGRLAVRQRFTLDAANTLTVETIARCTKATLFAPTLHPYFNLTGDPTGDVLEHELRTPASHWLPVDDHGIPTGEIADVEDTPFDFRNGGAIDGRVDDPLLAPRGGFDHALVLDKAENAMALAAILTDPGSGRRLSIATTMPTLQVYTANALPRPAGERSRPAICLETQHHPDAPNHDAFPTPILRPNERYYARTTYRFDTIPG